MVPPERCVTALRPGHEVGEDGVGLGEVGLEHDARGDGRELRFVEHARKRRHRQLEVTVLFHVQVDERRVRLGLAVEGAHLRGHAFE